jgi:hypothetical protein
VQRGAQALHPADGSLTKVFILFVVAAEIFIWLTSAALPPSVASHFAAGGAANGFMSRGAYVGVMLGVTLVAPFLVALSGQLVSVLPVRLINLPNRQYWLAPRRRAATIASLTRLSVCFASALIVFLCFLHWLVIRANESPVPRLERMPMFIGLALFLAGTVVWLVVLVRRFGRVH